MGSGTQGRPCWKRWRWLLLVGVLIATVEVVLRVGFGFCDAVLIRTDPHYEYIAQASQDRHRFGRHIVYNSYSMRSEEPDSTAVIVLGCGDSVINGGSLTDNDSLATTLLSARLSQVTRRKVQVLNISAGSWGPDNCAAYLANTTLPRAKALLLVVSSHDAHDNMSFKNVVGVRKHFPAEQYSSAIVELLDRYVLPRYIKRKKPTDADLGVDKGEDGFNAGFEQLRKYAEDRSIPFVIYLHAECSEIRKGRYNAQGEEIIRYAEAAGVPLIMDLEQGAEVNGLRDDIHPNEAGYRQMADLLFPTLEQHVRGDHVPVE